MLKRATKMTAAQSLLRNEQSEEKNKRKEISSMKVKTDVKAGPGSSTTDPPPTPR